jgi:NAD-dependent dihydropyrimidine dehydrogenase PreA subunit
MEIVGMVIKKFKSGSVGVTIEIDHDKCDGKGGCVDVCPAGVYEIVDEKSTAPNVDKCQGCCVCVDTCPVGAIKHSACG